MSCGCGAMPGSTTPTQSSRYVASRAALCQTCRHAMRDDRRGAVACRLSGRKIVSLVVSAHACPIGRHPDDDGIVRWMGLRWMGVPEPLRWRLVWMLRREPRGLHGCGCVAAIKASRAAAWIEPWVDGVVALRARLVAAMSDWRDAMGR